MTKFEPTLNQVNVTIVNNHPVRFIPVWEYLSLSGRSGDWHGWSVNIFRTKTGKLIAGFVSWSCVQGERDYLHVILAEDEKDLYAKLDTENYVHRLVSDELASKAEIVPTV